MPDIIQELIDRKIAVCAGREAVYILEILYQYGFYYGSPGTKIPFDKVCEYINRFGDTLCFNCSKMNKPDGRHIGYDCIDGMTRLGYEVIAIDDFVNHLECGQVRYFDQEAFNKLIT